MHEWVTYKNADICVGVSLVFHVVICALAQLQPAFIIAYSDPQ